MFAKSPHVCRLLVLSLLCVCTGAIAAAGPPPLIWRGDITTARGVVTDVAHAWHKSGHAKIELQPFNTISGIDAVAHGTADIAGSARGDAPGRSNESALTFTPVAWDALVMITHPGNPVHSISLKQLHDIYFGKITNWSVLGGRDAPIDLYAVASPSDGVEFSLRKLLYGRGNQPVAVPRLYVNVAKLEQAVALDPDALGVSTLAGVHGNRKLQMIAIDNVMPSAATVASGKYRLYTPLYLVTNSNSPKAAAAQQFLAFMNGPKARAIMRSHDLLPYSDGANLAAGNSARVAAIAAAVGRSNRSTPISAPGATYASRMATAPTSQRTAEAHAAMQDRRNADAAAKAAAKARFAGVDGSVTSTAQPGFGTVSGSVSGTTLAAADKASEYKVVRGDTLSSIARRHSVSVAQMRAWNGIHGNNLQVGQVLRVRAR